MDTSPIKQFTSPEDEITFLKKRLAETQTEFLEFQESSRELELEYETQVKQLELKNNEQLSQLNKLDLENDQLKSKYAAYTNDTQHKLNEYQEQLADLQALNTRLTSYIRELEQNNDDLERARRALTASLEDFEGQLNQQIERNVLLENEVSEKEELECVVQRLKEETRDLKHELTVHSKQNDSARRKQLLMDNQHLASLQTDSSLVSINSPIPPVNLDAAKNAQSSTPRTPTSPIPQSRLVNGSVQAKPSMVDSTTSPTQTSTRFSFSTQDEQLESVRSRASDTQSPTVVDLVCKSQQTSAEPSPTKSAMLLTPSSRISALNIVSDLLRKVMSLESKLATSKKVIPPTTS